MSDSPQSPSKDVDHGAQSPDEEQMNDPSDPHSGGLSGYELAEGVKEQDRWLPIANGEYSQTRGSSVICPLSSRALLEIASHMWELLLPHDSSTNITHDASCLQS